MSTIVKPPVDRLPDRSEVVARPPPRGRASGRIVAAAILISLGVVMLAANYLSITGGALFIGLGIAFVIARLATGHYGYAPPAGILLGFGAFAALDEAGVLPADSGGWFFVLLGAGFLAVYVFGGRVSAIWPIFPALALLAFGAILLDQLALGTFAGLAGYWPVGLILIGLWLLVRDRLPPSVRQPLLALGVAFLLLTALGALASAALAGAGVVDGFGGAPLFAPTTSATVASSTTLSAPIGSGNTLRVVNQTGGSTIVRPGQGSDVNVVAKAAAWWQGQPANVTLTPAGGILTLEARRQGMPLGITPRVDYAVDVPSSAQLEILSSSGDVEVSGLSGPVRVQSSSGLVSLSDLSGPVDVQSSSGDVRLANVPGALNATTSSGSIEGTNLGRVQSLTSSSGRITFDAQLTGSTSVHSSSGDVDVRLASGSSTRVDVATSSGNIRLLNLSLANQQQDRHRLTGVLGQGDGQLTVHTSSGSVTLAGR